MLTPYAHIHLNLYVRIYTILTPRKRYDVSLNTHTPTHMHRCKYIINIYIRVMYVCTVYNSVGAVLLVV